MKAIVATAGRDQWKSWITYGRPGTLMPAFAQSHGGSLSEEQTASVAGYLVERFPRAAGPRAHAPPVE